MGSDIPISEAMPCPSLSVVESVGHTGCMPQYFSQKYLGIILKWIHIILVYHLKKYGKKIYHNFCVFCKKLWIKYSWFLTQRKSIYFLLYFYSTLSINIYKNTTYNTNVILLKLHMKNMKFQKKIFWKNIKIFPLYSFENFSVFQKYFVIK